MHSPIFEGVGTALVTPFDKENKVNFDRLEQLIEFQIESEVDALIICGTTGEPCTLNKEEYYSVVANAIENVDSRIPVIVGAGTNDTRESIERAKNAEKCGADALLLVTPYYNKTSQLGLIKHYEAICGSVSLPAIVYNVPGRTGMGIDIDTYEQLDKIPNIVGVKEASGNISNVAKIIARFKDRFDVYSGNDDIIVPAMSLGAKGVISVASNIIPDIIFDICQFCYDNNFREAGKLQIEYMDLINALFADVNPIPVKEALGAMGIDVGRPRPPLFDLSYPNRMKLINTMRKHELI